MKKLTTLIISSILLGCSTIFMLVPFELFSQTEGSFKDSRDNRVYQSVKIGKKTWMAENLKYASKTGSWVYNNDTANAVSFGLLYDWNTASGACPKGWVLPSEQEWTALISELGGKDAAGGKLQKMDSANQKIIKKAGDGGKILSTLLGGVRHGDGTFSGIGFWGGFWSATVAPEGTKNFLFARGDKGVVSSSNAKESGFSVRCVKK